MSGNNHGKGKVVLEIKPDAEGEFIRRINRFLGEATIRDKREYIHIHDPGRLEELLYKGNRILLKRYSDKKRKTKWELIASHYKGKWILTNSKFHRKISENILRDPVLSPFGNFDSLKAEVLAGKSRLDYLLLKGNRKIWIEVKGCTLEKNYIALFPDAPTERGRRHISELRNLMREGNEAALLILIFHPFVTCFSPNEEKDPLFAQEYLKAISEGLKVYPITFSYMNGEIKFERRVPLCPKYS